MILGLYEWVALLIATYFIGAQELNYTWWFLLSYAVSYWVSYELSFVVQHMIIRMELENNEKPTV
jgi:hypothetical protein